MPRNVVSALLVSLGLLMAGCITSGRPAPQQPSSSSKDGERNRIAFGSEGAAELRYYDRSQPVLIKTSLEDNSKLGVEDETITLANESMQYSLDVTFSFVIPTSRIRDHIRDLMLTDERAREKFADLYEKRLGLLELDCQTSPLCLATVQLDKTSSDKRATEKRVDAWLFALDEQETTPFYILRSSDGSNWEPPAIDGKDRAKAFLKLSGKTTPALVVELGDTGIIRSRFRNPRDPVFIFEGSAESKKEDSGSDGKSKRIDQVIEALGAPESLATDSETEGAAVPVQPADVGLDQMRQKTYDEVTQAQREEEEIAVHAEREIRSLVGKASQPEIAAKAILAKKTLEAVKSLNVSQATDKAGAIQEIRFIRERFDSSLKSIGDVKLDDSVREPVMLVVADQAAAAIQKRADNFVQRERKRNEERLKSTKIRFYNQTTDRYCVITFTIQQEDCKSDDVIRFSRERDGNCTGTLSISPRSYVDIDASVVERAPRKILQFNVDFFDQTDDPADSTGYIALNRIKPGDPQFQPPDRAVTGVVASLNSKAEPFLSSVAQQVDGSLSPLFDGRQQTHYNGSGRLDFSLFYGNRASAKLNVSYKDGDFGGVEDTNKISASQYQINVFGTNALILNFGKMAFASPSNKIAINERGEGFRFSWKNMQISHILKRESSEGKVNSDDQDKDSWIFQVSPIAVSAGIFRSLNFTAVRGEERFEREEVPATATTPLKPQISPYVYETYGGEVFFTEPLRKRGDTEEGRAFSGSLAGYYSRRNSKATRTVFYDGEGAVGLFSISFPFNWEKEGEIKRKPNNVATLYLGYGTGDDPQTTKDEGYIGETGAFSRDAIFLGTFPTNALKYVAPGLSNKQYLGLQLTDNTFSLPGWLATELLKIDPSDIVSQSTTLRLHDYRFNREILGARDAGREMNLEFVLEAPKSIKWSLSGAYFMPGKSLKNLVRDEAWAITAGVSIDPFN